MFSHQNYIFETCSDIKMVDKTLEVTGSSVLKLFCFYFCHQVAVDSLKRVFSWGWGGLGRLGHAEQKDEMIPRLIKFFDTQSRGVKSVHCGSSFSLAINELGKREESRKWNCGIIATDLLKCTRPVLWQCLYRGCNDFFISKFHVRMTVHRNKLLFDETNRQTRSQIYSCTKLYVFRVVPLPIIRS